MPQTQDMPGDIAGIFERLRARLGPRGVLDQPDDMAPFLKEWRGNFESHAVAVLCPDSTQAVAEAVSACAEAGLSIVPQGGNTGLCGGAAAPAAPACVILSTRRLNRIRSVDPQNDTMCVEAGVVLQEAQMAAARHDKLFPLSLGAEGTCQIGGNLSTNAGGIHVLRYGNARDLVLGLEVVLPDGRIWNGLRALRKDNTGYDLKQLFIGAEGTLGIITAAVLKVFPLPRETESALLAVATPGHALSLLHRMRAGCGEALSAFELMPRASIDLAVRHIPGTVDPLATRAPWYVLVELASAAAGGVLARRLEDTLEAATSDGLVLDGTVARNETQHRALWRLREAIVEAQRHEGASIKHDVSVPVSHIPTFIERADAAVRAAVPGARPLPFGHIGDGNIHFNITQPVAADGAAFLARWHEINRLVHDIVIDLGGSISAEHGIGRLKRDELASRADAVEIDLMRRIKATIDPQGLMNPGAVL